MTCGGNHYAALGRLCDGCAGRRYGAGGWSCIALAETVIEQRAFVDACDRESILANFCRLVVAPVCRSGINDVALALGVIGVWAGQACGGVHGAGGDARYARDLAACVKDVVGFGG